MTFYEFKEKFRNIEKLYFEIYNLHIEIKRDEIIDINYTPNLYFYKDAWLVGAEVNFDFDIILKDNKRTRELLKAKEDIHVIKLFNGKETAKLYVNNLQIQIKKQTLFLVAEEKILLPFLEKISKIEVEKKINKLWKSYHNHKISLEENIYPEKTVVMPPFFSIITYKGDKDSLLIDLEKYEKPALMEIDIVDGEIKIQSTTILLGRLNQILREIEHKRKKNDKTIEEWENEQKNI